MTLVKVKCFYCSKKYLKELRRFNETRKFGWKNYCSIKCQSLTKNKQKTLKCGNPSCNKVFKRAPNEIPASGICFCSRSCAAIVNNLKSPKRRSKIRKCPVCGKQFIGHRKYCSNKCVPPPEIVTKQEIIKQIKKFYEQHKRIPLKREFAHYQAARNRFGTWNRTIKTAGFDPNPVLFAKKCQADDGHICDSLSEKIIDDWLYARKIKHKINIPYPGNNGLTVDFLVRDWWIEFFGLSGEVKKYDELKKKKIKLVKKHKLSFIEIYPKHLFPENKLNELLGFLTDTTRQVPS